MSRLLEIFGRALDVNAGDLIWHWLNTVESQTFGPGTQTQENGHSAQLGQNSSAKPGLPFSEDPKAQQNAFWSAVLGTSYAGHPTAKPVPDNIAEKDFNEIVQLIRRGSLDAADEKLKFHLFENPSCVKGRMAAAAICLHRNRARDAIEALQSVYLRQPSNTMALYALGHCYERLGSEAEAVEFYQDCLKFKSHLQLPRYRLAAIYFKNRQIEKTIQEYELLTNEYPDDISSLVTLGYLYIANHKYSLAIKAFNDAILMHPDNFHPDDYDSEIDMLIGQDKVREAVERVESQLDQQGETATLSIKLGDLLLLLGEDEQAVLHYEKALQSQPNSLVATIKLGTQHLKAQRQLPAAEHFNRAVEINDEIVEAYLGLAAAQQLAGSSEQAGATLSLASAIQQNSTVLFCQVATLQLRNALENGHNFPSLGLSFHGPVPNGDPGKWEPIDTPDFSGPAGPSASDGLLEPWDQGPESQETHPFDPADDFNKLLSAVIRSHEIQLAKCPSNADIYYRYGLLLMSTGRVSKAISAFESAVQTNPTYHRARCKLVICLYDLASKSGGTLTGDTASRHHALIYLTQPEALTKEILDLHYKTAVLYCDRTKFALAVENLQRSLDENFTKVDAATNLCVVLENLRLVDRADATWQCLSETARHGMPTDEGPGGAACQEE